MARIFAPLVTGFALAIAAWGADQSAGSKSEEPDSFDVEPPILKQNLSDEPFPHGDLARRENKSEPAKQNTPGPERLYKTAEHAQAEDDRGELKERRAD